MQEGPAQPKKINDSVWEFCKPSDPTVEIVFFHGIQLHRENTDKPQFSTWTKKESSTEYWPQTFFAEDEALTGEGIRVRALSAAYDASVRRTDSQGRLDLHLIAENFISTIIDNSRVKLGQTKNVPVILVGHSFGGLLIKYMLNQAAEKARRGGSRVRTFLDNLAGVFFYSTPHLALKDEVFEELFPKDPNIQYSDLVPLFEQLNKHVARLEERMNLLVRNQGKNWGGIEVVEVFEANETDLGYWKGLIVEEGAARGAANEGSVINEDHFNICRPEDLESDSYQKLAELLIKIHEKAKFFADEAAEMDLELPPVPSAPVRGNR